MAVRRDTQRGATLILLIGVIAALAILAATLVMVTVNAQDRTAADRTKTKAFNAAEAALDKSMYSIGMTWRRRPGASRGTRPASTPRFSPAVRPASTLA